MANLQIIRDLSEDKRITIRKIAENVGITESALQTMIRKGSTNTTTLEKIAEVLNVPVGIFFDDTPAGTINQTGKGNIVGNSNRVTISDCEKENAHLRALLVEKERTIQILMNK